MLIGSRWTRRRSESGGIGSSEKVSRVCWIARAGRTTRRTALPAQFAVRSCGYGSSGGGVRISLPITSGCRHRRSNRSCAARAWPGSTALVVPPIESPVRLCQRDLPVELVHVEVNELSAVSDPARWWLADPWPRQRTSGCTRQGRLPLPAHRHRRTHAARLERDPQRRAGHHRDGVPAARQRLVRASRRRHRTLPDRQRGVYRSRRWAAALAETNLTHKRTRSCRLQTNGKVERFHRILLEGGASIRPWTSGHERNLAHGVFIRFQHHRRTRGALGPFPIAL